ncbi:uncharacterized protein BJ171DRAFT_30427 [Polychytrium aggregatum]|uniref:uncharacterized protein n=1 Tax=Polychytrium aggregatum TaxID=110093 RepID=UPI0022FDF695|nr:uncharacterized protein BJ171DRAFT_30427 [Polychytrium aggregatum]KAI9206438.1 hypothetical protein BJ171DRAFT_30427 [Polychytrium aggregatum]
MILGKSTVCAIGALALSGLALAAPAAHPDSQAVAFAGNVAGSNVVALHPRNGRAIVKPAIHLMQNDETEENDDETEENDDETEENDDETEENDDETEENDDETEENDDETEENDDETEENDDETEENDDETEENDDETEDSTQEDSATHVFAASGPSSASASSSSSPSSSTPNNTVLIAGAGGLLAVAAVVAGFVGVRRSRAKYNNLDKDGSDSATRDSVKNSRRQNWSLKDSSSKPVVDISHEATIPGSSPGARVGRHTAFSDEMAAQSGKGHAKQPSLQAFNNLADGHQVYSA